MHEVNLRQIQKTFGKDGGVIAVDDLDLSVPQGELLVLLGPSGCGKTTVLRSIAGLEQPDRGVIELGGQKVFDRSAGIQIPSKHRDIGMVFQSYALWPHMTVRENITFPLRARGMHDKVRAGAAEKAAELVECGPLLDRYPGQLSGGQQQRVALARGLVAGPAVLLLDEPLSNLDARLRNDLRIEIRSLHQKTGFTGIYVTHDQIEAFSVADRIVVMSQGRILQQGTPQTVHDRPKTAEVAQFLGIKNSLRVKVDGGQWALESDAVSRTSVTGYEELAGDLDVRFRNNSAVAYAASCPVPAESGLTLDGFSVESRVYSGSFWEYLLKKGEVGFVVHATCASRPQPFDIGAKVTAFIPSSSILVYASGLLQDPRS